MAISRTISRKSTSQAPKDFFACQPSSGGGKAPAKPASGKVREQIYGRKSLGK